MIPETPEQTKYINEQNKPYEAPQLIEYGAVEELTQLGGSI